MTLRTPGRRWLVATALLIASASSAGAQRSSRDADQIDRPEVTAFRIAGVKSVDRDELTRTLSTRASHCNGFVQLAFCPFIKSKAVYTREYLDPVELRRDVIRVRLFYYQHGYRDATVDTTVRRSRDNSRARITFRVTEGPPTILTHLELRGTDSLLSDRQRRRLVLVAEGKPYDLVKVDSTLVRLRDALAEQGYADAEIKTEPTVDDSLDRASLAIVADPKQRATIGDIAVTGNRGVAEATIRNSLTVKSGELFKLSEVIRSQRALYESNLFKRAGIVVNPAADTAAGAVARPDSVKALRIEVEEAPPRQSRVSAGFNTVDFVQVEGRFTHFDFFGGARRLDVSGAVGNLFARQLYQRKFLPFRDFTGDGKNLLAMDNAFFQPNVQGSVDVTQRWFGSPFNTVTLSVFGRRRAIPGVVIDRGYGGSGTFTRELAVRATASATYRYEITGVDAGQIYFCVNFGVCEEGAINLLSRRRALSPVAVTATVDRTDNPFFRTRGYIGRADAEYASRFTLSDFGYNRITADIAAYRPFLGGTIAGHLRGGWARATTAIGDTALGLDVLHPRKRFYAGGSQSVRGYGENQLGPRVLTIPSDKLRGKVVSNGVTSYLYCQPSTPIEQCPLNAVYDSITVNGARADTTRLSLRDRDFTPRPTGGSTLAEASVEYRFHVWQQLYAAAFVDAGVVGKGSLSEAAEGNGAITPGFGVRYRSPVGPIRVDVGFIPNVREDLTVITENDSATTGRRSLVELGTRRTYSSGGSGLFNRLTLHLSIGEAY